MLLVKWYDFVKWMPERVNSFPKNLRFMFGQRLADRSIRVLEILVRAAYRSRKAELLAEANRQIEVLDVHTFFAMFKDYYSQKATARDNK